MTAEEHDHMQELEGLVKRYRSRIVEMKAAREASERRAETVRAALEAAADYLRVSLSPCDPDCDCVLQLVEAALVEPVAGGNRTRPLGPEDDRVSR